MRLLYWQKLTSEQINWSVVPQLNLDLEPTHPYFWSNHFKTLLCKILSCRFLSQNVLHTMVCISDGNGFCRTQPPPTHTSMCFLKKIHTCITLWVTYVISYHLCSCLIRNTSSDDRLGTDCGVSCRLDTFPCYHPVSCSCTYGSCGCSAWKSPSSLEKV